MNECSQCKVVVDLTIPNSAYRCHACNQVFCQEHAGQHFSDNQGRAERAEQKLKEMQS